LQIITKNIRGVKNMQLPMEKWHKQQQIDWD